jgi:hypothetical protein
MSFRSAALSREESAVSPLAASRFLADKAGFGMTRHKIVFGQNAPRLAFSENGSRGF